MQKTVTLNATHWNGGRWFLEDGTLSNSWTNLKSIGSTESNRYVGHRSGEYNATYILFDQADLAKYSSKKIISLTLTVYVQQGVISTTTTHYRVGFKLNGNISTDTVYGSSAWVRSNNTQTAQGTYDVAYLQGSTQSLATIDVGKTMPKYGYVIGSISTASVGNYVQLRGEDGAKLTIVYEEVGAYVKVGNEWKEGQVYVKVGDAWKEGQVYVKSGDTWYSS